MEETLVFHNFAGVFGVIQAPESWGNLASFECPVLLVVALIAATALLIATHVLWLDRGVPGDETRSSRVG